MYNKTFEKGEERRALFSYDNLLKFKKVLLLEVEEYNPTNINAIVCHISLLCLLRLHLELNYANFLKSDCKLIFILWLIVV